ISGATYIANGSLLAGIQTFTGTIPASFAGTTFRLIFSWKSDTSVGTNPPAAIDNIRLISGASNVAATCATTFSPADGATGVNLPGTISWSGATGLPFPAFDVYFSTTQALVTANDPSVRIATGTSATSVTPPAVAASTTYYWKVVPTNVAGAATGCVVNSFTTAALSAAACPASYTPSNLSPGIALPPTLSWAASSGNPGPTYTVFFSANQALVAARDVSVRQVTGLTTNSWTPTGIIITGTTYYWMVVPTNSTGGPASCTVNSFETVAPTVYSATAQGGLWSSAATWSGGVVPPNALGHDIFIPTGSVVTVDQVISYRNYQIEGTLNWNATANAMSASGNVTIGSTGRFIPITTAGG
ncbi:MAG: hypothetical protein ACKO7B_09650, partial [Flavobacteriales bacterium]